MLQLGRGLTVRTTSLVLTRLPQSLESATENRKVAVADEPVTCAVIGRDKQLAQFVGSSMVTGPETTLHHTFVIGDVPTVAVPTRENVVDEPSVHLV
jgi:hypothetical protein